MNASELRPRAISLLLSVLAIAAPSLAASPRLPVIKDKTLVAWICPANLVQRGGSVLTLDDQQSHFDGIVFGELAPGKWMAGSDLFKRSQKDQASSPPETADSKTRVQIAVVYRGRQITLYRDGKQYAQYQVDQPQEFGPGSAVVIGLRHLQAGDRACFAGSIEDARVYNVPLSAEQIAALRPKKPSQPEPLAWWTFEGGKADDHRGAFPVVELAGGARVADGRLLLDGKGAFLFASQKDDTNYASPIHYRPRTGVFADPIPFFWKGEYHVFYLRGGIGRVPWEHIVSKDLVHWKELPTALVSDGEPNGPDGGQMFTGSVVDGLGRFHIFYTGDNGANPRGTEFIMHATSPDLIHWTKHPEDMIAPDGIHYKNARSRDFRDPYVFWNAQEKCYWMVFFANDAKTGEGVQGLALSKDLKHWEFQPPLAGAGGQECPDLFPIGGHWCLIGGDHYSVAKEPRGPFTAPPVSNAIDRPFIYAAKRTFDGKRHIWTGWLWDRSPKRDSGGAQWGGTQCLPRELRPGPGGELYSRPADEITAVFTRTVLDLAEKPRLAVLSGQWDYAATGLAGSGEGGGSRCAWEVPDHYMLQCRIQLDPKAEFTLTMRQTEEPNSGYRLSLRPEKQEAEIASPAFRESRRIRLDASQPVAIQAFVQGSMIETFINDQYALSCRAYDFPTGKLVLGVRGGGAKVLTLRVKVYEPAEESRGASQ
ncbi:MAG: LamG-like jellyroll fold domain-containing protein [Thermoguttaceae bacterium]